MASWPPLPPPPGLFGVVTRAVQAQDVYWTATGGPKPQLLRGSRGRRPLAVRVPAEPETGNAAARGAQLATCWTALMGQCSAAYGESVQGFMVQVQAGRKPQRAADMAELLRHLDAAQAAGVEQVIFAIVSSSGEPSSATSALSTAPLLGPTPGRAALQSAGDSTGRAPPQGGLFKPQELFGGKQTAGDSGNDSGRDSESLASLASRLDGRHASLLRWLACLALLLVVVTVAQVTSIAWVGTVAAGAARPSSSLTPTSSPASTPAASTPASATPAASTPAASTPASSTPASATPASTASSSAKAPPPPTTKANDANLAPPTLADTPTGTVRWYYFCTEDLLWSFAPLGVNTVTGAILPPAQTTLTVLTTYNGYSDSTFTQQSTDNLQSWIGIMGPPIRAEVGDVVRVKMLNRASQPYSLHPHGLRYDHPNSGADDIGSTATVVGGVTSSGQGVLPGQQYTYSWYVGSDAGPLLSPSDPYFQSTVAWPYHSHYNEPVDVQRGLYGPVIVAARGCANATGGAWDLLGNNEYMLFFINMATHHGTYYTVNGVAWGNLQGIVVDRGAAARFHLFTLGTTQDQHPIHWHAKTVKQGQYNLDTINISPGTSWSVDFTSYTPGRWLLHCHEDDHLQNGMFTWYTITGNETDQSQVPLRGILPAGAQTVSGNYDASVPGADGAVRNVDVLTPKPVGAVVPVTFTWWPPPSPGSPIVASNAASAPPPRSP